MERQYFKKLMETRENQNKVTGRSYTKTGKNSRKRRYYIRYVETGEPEK